MEKYLKGDCINVHSVIIAVVFHPFFHTLSTLTKMQFSFYVSWATKDTYSLFLGYRMWEMIYLPISICSVCALTRNLVNGTLRWDGRCRYGYRIKLSFNVLYVLIFPSKLKNCWRHSWTCWYINKFFEKGLMFNSMWWILYLTVTSTI